MPSGDSFGERIELRSEKIWLYMLTAAKQVHAATEVRDNAAYTKLNQSLKNDVFLDFQPP